MKKLILMENQDKITEWVSERRRNKEFGQSAIDFPRVIFISTWTSSSFCRCHCGCCSTFAMFAICDVMFVVIAIVVIIIIFSQHHRIHCLLTTSSFYCMQCPWPWLEYTPYTHILRINIRYLLPQLTHSFTGISISSLYARVNQPVNEIYLLYVQSLNMNFLFLYFFFFYLIHFVICYAFCIANILQVYMPLISVMQSWVYILCSAIICKCMHVAGTYSCAESETAAITLSYRCAYLYVHTGSGSFSHCTEICVYSSEYYYITEFW